jgi:hypothetical protein
MDGHGLSACPNEPGNSPASPGTVFHADSCKKAFRIATELTKQGQLCHIF